MRLLFALVFALAWPVSALAEPPILRLSLEAEPATLDWARASTPSDRFIVSFLMRGLLRYDSAGKPVCDLCASFSESQDGKTYRFELNPDEKWSDGELLDASQFVEAFRRVLNPQESIKAAASLSIISGAVQSKKAWDPRKLEVKAKGRTTLEVLLDAPSSLFPHLLTMAATFPIRSEQLRGAASGGEALASGPVLGPYGLAAWEKGKRLVIEANPRYRGERPVFRVDFVLGKHAQQVQNFRKGKVDILAAPTTEELLKLSQKKNVQVSSYWATRALWFNTRGKLAGDVAFRRALLLALDRGELPSVLKNGERASTGLIPAGLPGHRPLALASRDLERARSELARSAGAGGKAAIELLARDTVIDRELAKWLMSELGRLPVGLTTRFVSDKELESLLEKGKFDLALRTWTFGIASPLEILAAFRTGSPLNVGRWTSVAFDALLEQLEREARPDAFMALVDQATRVLEIQDTAVIPLGYPTLPFLLGNRVTSFAMTPFGDPDLVKIQLRQ